jgi:hypothetical protein
LRARQFLVDHVFGVGRGLDQLLAAVPFNLMRKIRDIEPSRFPGWRSAR